MFQINQITINFKTFIQQFEDRYITLVSHKIYNKLRIYIYIYNSNSTSFKAPKFNIPSIPMSKNNRIRINRPSLNHVHLQTIRPISYLSPSPAVFFFFLYHLGYREANAWLTPTPPLNAQSSAFFRSAGFHGAAGNFPSYRERDVIALLSLSRFRLDFVSVWRFVPKAESLSAG